MFYLLFFVALAAGLGLSWRVRRVALRRRAVVPPRQDRWHRESTPTFGGVAIAGATLAPFAAWAAGGVDPAPWVPIAIGVAGLGMFLVGFFDDRLQLSPLAKLMWSLIIGGALIFTLQFVQHTTPHWAVTVLAVVWFGGIVHAFNLLDNMDGLAGGIGLIVATGLVVVAGPVLEGIAGLLACLAGALVGFLYWNRSPARLFMGDCGSLFIGAVLGGVSLAYMLGPEGDVAWNGTLMAMTLAVPLFDTSFVLVLRRLAGRAASRGGTDHVSHRLVSLGLSERSAVRVLYGLAVLGAGLAWLVSASDGGAIAYIALFVVALLLAGIYLARVPAYNGEDFGALQKASFGPFLKDLTFRWHVAEILLDVVLIAVVYWASYGLRFEDERYDVFITSFTASLPIVLACKLGAFYVSGLYSRMWGTFGLRDLYTVIQGVALGSALSVMVAAYFFRFERFSRGVFIIDAALLTLAIIISRGSFRLMGEAAVSRSKQGRRVLIYGAGSGGQLLVREMRVNADWLMNPIAFIDDDPTKFKRRVLGVPVKGNIDGLERLLDGHKVDEVVLSTIAVNGTKEQRVRDLCRARGVAVRRLHLELR
jgi:UDP-GlcNAc:undecaprenyl-phosphate GlcNAc-1-phosphate transferase